MSSLRAIKTKIRSVGKTHQVTKAMEAVSGVKMRKAQLSALSARPYAMAALRILERVSSSVDMARHPLIAKRNVQRVFLVIITSDRGLAGGLNSTVIKHTVNKLSERGIKREDIGILAIGRKGEEYFTRRGYLLEKHIPSLKDESTMGSFSDIVSLVTDLFTRESYDECALAYTNFHSTFEQEAVVRTLLPLSVEGLQEMIVGITPKRGKFAETKEETEKPPRAYTLADTIMEPSPEEVFETLLPRLLSIELHHAFLEAKASEHSARMVAMRNASDKARDVGFFLTRDYNKARQAAITREMSEIIGGIEAMK